MKYIDAEALKAELSKAPVWTTLAVKELVNDEAFEIVHCDECRYCKEQGGHANCNGYLYCTRRKTLVDETCFCSWGEEK